MIEKDDKVGEVYVLWIDGIDDKVGRVFSWIEGTEEKSWEGPSIMEGKDDKVRRSVLWIDGTNDKGGTGCIMDRRHR